MYKTINLVTVLALFSSALAHGDVPAATDYFYQKEYSGKDNRGTWKIEVPRFTKVISVKSVRSKLNSSILKYAKSYLCDANKEQKDNYSSEVSGSILALRRDLVSVELTFSYQCGGPYPGYGTSTYLYDLNTGDQVELSSQIKDVEKLKAIAVRALINSAPKDAEGLPAEDGCAQYYNEENIQFPSYSVLNNTIEVSTDFVHAIQACNFSARIDIDELKALLKPESLLAKFYK